MAARKRNAAFFKLLLWEEAARNRSRSRSSFRFKKSKAPPRSKESYDQKHVKWKERNTYPYPSIISKTTSL
jgi:hypothetical protein